MSHKRVCDCSFNQMEQQDLDVGVFMPNLAGKTRGGRGNFPKLLHQHRGDMGSKNLHFRATLVILFVMKYEWEIAPECDIFSLLPFISSSHSSHFKAPSCQCTEQMCHAATDCINQPPLPHLICLICTG